MWNGADACVAKVKSEEVEDELKPEGEEDAEEEV